MPSRREQSDIIEAAARHALSVHEEGQSAPLTPYGIARCAAALALVLTDDTHPNHSLARENHLKASGA